MTLDELDTRVRECETAGHERILLMVPRKRRPRHEGQLFPGVPCWYAGWEDGRALADVRVADLRRWLDRSIPAPAAHPSVPEVG